MHFKIHQDQLEQMRRERNSAWLMILGLFVVSLMQTMVIFRIGDGKRAYFTPLPPFISQPFSISRDHLSPSYLADLSRYFILLRLNYTPSSFPSQIPLLLRYSDARYYSVLKNKLWQEENQAKAHDVSMTFMPVETKVDDKTLTVWLSGDLISFVGQTRLPTKRMTYKIHYAYRYGILSIVSLT